MIDPEVGKPVSKACFSIRQTESVSADFDARHLNKRLCKDHGLVRGMKEKHVIGHKSLPAALYYAGGPIPNTSALRAAAQNPRHNCRAVLSRCEADAPASSGWRTPSDDEGDHSLKKE